MKFLPLTKGYFAIVDDQDYQRAMLAGPWYVDLRPQEQLAYAKRKVGPGRIGRRTQPLHRFLLGFEPGQNSSLWVDHKNHNGLDCRRSNIRTCSSSQNFGNRRKLLKASSAFRGVQYYPKNNSWRVFFRRRWLGSFSSEKQAARAFDVAARAFYGEFARLNLSAVA